jgi:ribose transport system substrate-binding protein
MTRARIVLSAIVAAGAIAGCSREDAGKPRFAFVTNGIAEFWTIAEAGVDAAAKDFDVAAATYKPKDVVEQKSKLEDLIASGVAGIAVSPINPDDMRAELDLVASKTILITHDSDAPASQRRVYVGMDNYDAGWLAGELVRKACPGGGKIALFIGRVSQDNAKRRRQGVIDAVLGRDRDPTRYDPPGAGIEGGGYVIVDTYLDEFDQAKGKANAEDALSVHRDLACMVGLFQYNPPLCLGVLRQAGKLGAVKVVGFDEHDATLQGIVDGDVFGTVVQDPYQYGYKSIEVMARLHRGESDVVPGTKFVDLPGRVVDASNVREFWDDLKAKTGRN